MEEEEEEEIEEEEEPEDSAVDGESNEDADGVLQLLLV